jgi:dihydroxyacid dehydratase/phosphogluconate dehydratase
LLIDWASSNTYPKRLQELEEAGLIRRDSFYIIGERSKNIVLNWNYRHPSQAILRDSRAPDTLEETLRVAYGPEELRAILKQAGMDKGLISRFLKTVYDEPPQRAEDSFPMPST